MQGAPEFLEFVELRAFARQAEGIFDDQDMERLKKRLSQNPQAGVVIPGTSGMRKLRVAIGGRGARGGARLIYYLRLARGRVFLVAIYAKNVKDDLTSDEKRHFRSLTAILDKEG